jgi:energy-coupling factor transporter ATP-binding protein EcfA2
MHTPLPTADDLADAAVRDALAAWPDGPLDPAPTDELDAPPGEVWLQQLTVEGLRGAGPPVTLELPAGPGLTVIAAPNGSGKSSLSDALELLLCDRASRWHGRDKGAASGWRNLHHDAACVRATFLVDGEAVTATRQWSGDLHDSELICEPAGRLPSLASARQASPVLACGELCERLRGRPAQVYDAVVSVLGLDPLEDGRDRLGSLRRQLSRTADHERAERDRLLAALLQHEHAPPEVIAALTADDPDALADALRTTGPPDDDDHAAHWAVPELHDVAADLDRLRDALQRHRQVTDRLDHHLDDQVRLLEAALPLALDTTDCPLCGTASALPDGWADATTARLAALSATREEAQQAKAELANLHHALSTRLRALPRPDGLLEGWWPLPDRPEALLAHVRALWPSVRAVLASRRDQARQRRQQRQASWAPLAAELSSWLPLRRRVEAEAPALRCIQQAEELLHQRLADHRAQRFAPLRASALRLWSLLRQASTVELTDVDLSGRRTRRRLDLDVRLDGQAAAAQGVMSQGELNALALALFVPRAMLDAHPFRFVLIDDPVQAMDPAKISGLAEVLRELSAVRQVVVLTHDERLLSALRWQRVPHRTVHLSRAPGSCLTLHQADDPVRQLLDEAHVVLSSSLPTEVKRRVVPGLCRLALEQALHERLGARWVGEGMPCAEVHRRLNDHPSLRARLGLWWFDDPRAPDPAVGDRLQTAVPDGVALYEALQKGAHGDGLRPGKLAGRTRALVDALGDP